MTNIVCTGGHGRVGKLLAPYGIRDLGCDVTNPLEVQRSIKYFKPEIIVHLASRSDVNWCEQKENADEAIAVNFVGAMNVVTAAEQVGCSVVLLSSDHVFSGKKWWGKYKEGDEREPLNLYGMTKVSAEGLQGAYDNLKIVRTSYLFDYSRVEYDLSRIKSNPIYCPSFIKRSFMYAPQFVQNLCDYLYRFQDMPKILHISGSEIVSWHGFMSMVANKYGLDMSRVIARTKPDNGHAPRGHRLGLDVSLSAKLQLTQFNYLDGINQMVLDGR